MTSLVLAAALTDRILPIKSINKLPTTLQPNGLVPGKLAIIMVVLYTSSLILILFGSSLSSAPAAVSHQTE